MYPAYLGVAELQEEAKARRSMEHALAAEKVHAELYARAKESVAAGSDLTLAKVYVCDVCGYTMEGDAPDRCPVCGAQRSHFVEF
jgi:rubrerythrin